jgi:hypothetical protein
VKSARGADQIILFTSRRPWHLAYGRPPAGKPRERASGTEIALRALVFLVAVAIVSVTTFWPLAQALF